MRITFGAVGRLPCTTGLCAILPYTILICGIGAILIHAILPYTILPYTILICIIGVFGQIKLPLLIMP
jgi:hypothetical protein